jgi:hypothetical protein
MLDLGWIAIIILVVWRIAFAVMKRNRRSNERRVSR